MDVQLVVLFGTANASTVQECENLGDIEGEFVGGIVGCPNNGTLVSACVNKGHIVAKYHSVNGNGLIGGICSYACAAGKNTTIDSCYNTGRVSGLGQGCTRWRCC